MAVKASAVVAAARTMLTGWEYVLGAHGRFDSKTGKSETDCQYLVDRTMVLNGMAHYLGPELPWEVAYMVDHSTFRREDPSITPLPGWIAVFGTPGASDYRVRYAHTGIVTSATTYISALNPAQGIRETKIAATPLHVMLWLDTYVDQDTIPAPAPEPPTLPAPQPPASVGPAVHTVIAGDSLSKIGREYGVSVAQLVKLNEGKYPSLASNPGLIRVGWVLALR